MRVHVIQAVSSSALPSLGLRSAAKVRICTASAVMRTTTGELVTQGGAVVVEAVGVSGE